MFVAALAVIWLSSNSRSISSLIRLCCKFICMAFKSHTERSHVPYVSTLILPITVGTFHSLNCFGDVIYMPQTHTYQNIAKLLNHPRILESTYLDHTMCKWHFYKFGLLTSAVFDDGRF